MKKIGIHSVPRSGSTWLGAIMDSNPHVAYKMQPLFSYAFKDYLDANSSAIAIEEYFQKISVSEDDFLTQVDSKKKGLTPIFEKSLPPTHSCYKEVRYHHILQNMLSKNSEVKIIGLVRNPFAVINSWLKAPKEFRSDLGWEIKEEWRLASIKNQNKPEEFNGYEKWKEITFLFLRLNKEFQDRFCLVQYENILENPVTEVKKVFNFAGLSLHPQTLKFLTNSRSSHIEDDYSVFKKKEDDELWKVQLPDFIIREIKKDPDFWRLNDQYQWI